MCVFYYSEKQLVQYFRRIGIPPSQWKFDVSQLSLEDALSYLTLVHQRMLQAIPYENFDWHYEKKGRDIDVSPTGVWRKIMVDALNEHQRRQSATSSESSSLSDGSRSSDSIVSTADSDQGVWTGSRRGGICYELNLLLANVLRTLGYKVTGYGARVFEGGGRWGSWSHLVHSVRIGGEKYIVDTGFGSRTAIQPVRLRNGTTVKHVGLASNMLSYEHLDWQTDPDQVIWCMKHQKSPDADWTPLYAFSEVEFLEQDIEMMAVNAGQNPHHWLSQRVVAMQFLGDGTQVIGTTVLNGDEVRVEKHGELISQRSLKDEEERQEAILDLFMISLDDNNLHAIKGLSSELRQTKRLARF